MPRLTVEQRLAEARAEAAKMAVDAYKEKVFRVGTDAKDRYGWCDSGFRDAMRELDIPVKGTYIVNLTVEVTISDSDDEDAAGDTAGTLIDHALSSISDPNIELNTVNVESSEADDI